MGRAMKLMESLMQLAGPKFESAIARQFNPPPTRFIFCPHGCASAPDKQGWGGANHYKELNFISNIHPIDENGHYNHATNNSADQGLPKTLRSVQHQAPLTSSQKKDSISFETALCR